MESKQKYYIEIFSGMCQTFQEKFPHNPLTLEDLKDPKPIKIMSAFIDFFTLLEMNSDCILNGTGDSYRDDHTEYYIDMLPVVNVVRVVNHIVTLYGSNNTLTLSNLLTPSTVTVTALMVLFNIVKFHERTLANIEARVEQVYQYERQVQDLMREHNDLLNQLNDASANRSMRPIRLKKLDEEVRILTSQLKDETNAMEELRQCYNKMAGVCRDIQVSLEQRKSQKEALVGELHRLQAQMVLDADDVRFQEEQACREEQEAADRLHTLKSTISGKETTINNLHAVKCKLDEANNNMDEIIELDRNIESIRCAGECSESDMETAIAEEERVIAELERCIKQVQYDRRTTVALRREQAQALQRDTHNNLLKSELNLKNCKSMYNEVQTRCNHIQSKTIFYETRRRELVKQFADIEDIIKRQLTEYEKEILEIARDTASTVVNTIDKMNKEQ